MQVHLTLKSRNVKTGAMPVSTTEATSCPEACPFKKNGCYADGGPLAMFWKKVNEHKAGSSWDKLCEQISDLKPDTIWRANQAGDLPGVGNKIDKRKLSALVKANKGKRGFTYTHKPMTKPNREAVNNANDCGFTINLSANNLKHADKLAALDIGPVVVVMPHDWTGKTETPEGRPVRQCPATFEGSTLTCKACGLCQKQRETIVAFPAHGASKKRATIAAQG